MRHTREWTIYLYECRIYVQQHPPMGGVFTLRGCLMAPFPIHLAPLGGSRYIYIYTVYIPHTLGLLTMVDFRSRRMYAITGITFSGCGLKRCLDLFFFCFKTLRRDPTPVVMVKKNNNAVGTILGKFLEPSNWIQSNYLLQNKL